MNSRKTLLNQKQEANLEFSRQFRLKSFVRCFIGGMETRFQAYRVYPKHGDK